ncbi:MAG: thymidine phosphorylase family protein [Wenzhouxiangella sp.]|nr:thymidine phosphorylase family protein [Wenzhouxiangella sp.]TVR92835.1 MAG: thymidine phosphorylase family protein [Wenzhouxiangellaceae bacterium]
MNAIVEQPQSNNLRARRMALDTHDQPVILTRRDCPVCRSEGFSAHARVRVQNGSRRIIATLYQIDADWLAPGEAGLSESAWHRLQIAEGDEVHLSHPQPLNSLSLVRGRIWGRRFTRQALNDIMTDVAAGRYADIHIAMLLTVMATGGLDEGEVIALTDAMIRAGDTLNWGREPIADKHCVGGLPGNRTTPLVVAIIAACGLWMPKTSSRAITSPAGTADTMETLAPVDLDTNAMRRVVEREGGCIVWGGAVRLSPVDDMLIRVARVMDLDAEAQLVASVLSKKIAAGSSHLVLDLPVGPTAKIRERTEAEELGLRLKSVAEHFGLATRVLITDGRAPVGRGIGPALEARDIISVLGRHADAPTDLRERALVLSAELLELTGAARPGEGRAQAEQTLDSGAAASKFEAICVAQGGLRQPPVARRRYLILAKRRGRVLSIDNRRLGRVAKLAGAPGAPAAGVELHCTLGDSIEREQPLYTIHAETTGELNYAREFAFSNGDIIDIAEPD